MANSWRDTRAREEGYRIVELYRQAHSRKAVEVVAREAAIARSLLGDPHMRRIFEEMSLLELCLSKALEAQRDLRWGFTKKHIRFAIDNLPNEDDVRDAFYGHPEGVFPVDLVFVARRRRRPNRSSTLTEFNPA